MIWRIISRNWYSVLVNGNLFGFSTSSRDLKQGDPLSSTLFIIAAKVLVGSLNKLNTNNDVIGFGLPKWSEKIDHLSYANDTILFFSSCYEPRLPLVITQFLKK